MVRHRIESLLIVLCILCTSSIPTLAVPPAICTKAVSSGNGDFLVIIQTEFEPSESNMPRTARQVTLEVFPREVSVRAKDGKPWPAAYWSDWVQWSVILDSHNMHPLSPCPLALITGDGEGSSGRGCQGGPGSRRFHQGRPAQGTLDT